MSQFAHLPPAQQRFLMWFSPMANVATNVVTPWVVAQQLKNKPIDPDQKQAILFQEIVRQAISGTIGLTTYFTAAWLAGRAMRGSIHKTFGQIIVGTIANFVGFAFIRPLVSTEIIARWLKRLGIEREGTVNNVRPGLVPPKPPPLPPAEQSLQAFWQNVESRAAGQFRGWA